MKAALIYINTGVGDDRLYFRSHNKIMFEFEDKVYESAFSLNAFYRYLRLGYFIKKKTATVHVNGKRIREAEERITKLLTKA